MDAVRPAHGRGRGPLLAVFEEVPRPSSPVAAPMAATLARSRPSSALRRSSPSRPPVPHRPDRASRPDRPRRRDRAAQAGRSRGSSRGATSTTSRSSRAAAARATRAARCPSVAWCSRSSACARAVVRPLPWRMPVEAGRHHRGRQRLAREKGSGSRRSWRRRAVADRRQRGHQRGRPARVQVRHGPWVTGSRPSLLPASYCSGGPLRKDVAGYDLAGLLSGSEGTLGPDHRPCGSD